MNITGGLMNGQVLQRDKRNMAHADVQGRASSSGPVEFRVLGAKKGAFVSSWQRAGHAAAGAWKARLSGLPAGGPYRVEFRIGTNETQKSCSIKNVYVGDLWFLAGQSNMKGVGNLENAPKPHSMVRCFYMRDEWDLAREPLHFIPEAVDAVHLNRAFDGKKPRKAEIAAARRNAQKGVGPGLYFAKAMLARTGVPQGLVPCAHGGTNMGEWAPALKTRGDASFYGAMLRRFRKLGQPIAGMLWYQGCAEGNPACAALYTKRMKELIKAVRRDFAQPRMPWAIVQIGRFLDNNNKKESSAWDSIQDQQRLLPTIIKHVDVVPSLDLELDDLIHISGAAHARLGARLARVMARLALGDRKEKPAIALKKVRWGDKLRTPSRRIYSGVEVTFANVTGGLRAQGRPYGFIIAAPSSTDKDTIYKTTLSGNRAFLESTMPMHMFHDMFLQYGPGLNPYANVIDGRDMAVPAFGPISIGNTKQSPFLVDFEVAELGEPKGGLKDLKPPAKARWRPAPKQPLPHLPFMIMPALLEEKRQGLYLFRATVQVARPMRVKLSLGSDSAIVVWLNNRKAYMNLKATNPMIPDEYAQPVRLRKGRNRLLLGFDSREGRGWGFALRFVSLRPNCAIPKGAIQPLP